MQKRAIRTAQLALDEINLLWLPVRRSWRLNERHYGDLTGKNKAETAAQYGEDQVKIWRRSYDVPPPIAADNAKNPNGDAQYASLPPDVIPGTGAPGSSPRMLPTGTTPSPPILPPATVLVVAHGNRCAPS